MKAQIEFTPVSVLLYTAPDDEEEDITCLSCFKRAVATFGPRNTLSIDVFDDLSYPRDYEAYRHSMTHCEFVCMCMEFMKILGIEGSTATTKELRGRTKDETIKRMKACAAYARLL
jgi:hypothetical protein